MAILTFSQWTTDISETNSYETDPLFTTVGSDFTLTEPSVGVNGGTTIGTITQDYSGDTRPQGGSFDIGAFESSFGGDAPLLCWKLVGQYENGRSFTLNGPDKFPGLDALHLQNLKSISVIEDGKKII